MSDVTIIGGGPAGSALGCYLSKAGIENTIFEGANHPRPHVGESMVTSSTRVFDEIGFLETMERERFVRKYGASWHAPHDETVFSIEFGEFPQKGIRQDYTYHVDRGKFDHLLLKHAESLGSKVHQGTQVTRVLFDGSRASGVRVRLDGQEVDVPAKVVVDASGRRTLLGNQLRLKKNDPLFNQFAVHAWYEGVDRGDEKTADHIHIYFLKVKRGWVWQIPITDEITSMGVVAEKEVFRESRLDVESYFDRYMRTNASLEHAMRDARRVNEFKSEGDYSYSMSKFAGDGFLLVGDAARFVDPIFSSGVSVALYSAKFASEHIERALRAGDVGETAFLPYEEKLRSGVNVWYEFITLYYKLLPIFTFFIRSAKYRIQVLQLLQGEVFDRDNVPVLEEMREFIRVVEESDHSPFKAALTDVPVD